MRNGINLGLRGALEIRFLPFNQGREFLAELEHEPILLEQTRLAKKYSGVTIITPYRDFKIAQNPLRDEILFGSGEKE